jgi:hypothetical protein
MSGVRNSKIEKLRDSGIEEFFKSVLLMESLPIIPKFAIPQLSILLFYFVKQK